MFRKVVIMLMAPRIDEAPDRWTAKITRSIDMPTSFEVDSGGYITQPTPEPRPPESPGANSEQIASVVPATYIQNDRLFIRGNAMSGAPIISGMK